jgi:hypothetical protein
MREERDYKMEIAERWQQAADVDDLAAALEDGTVVEKARELAKALLDPPSNFLNYRYQEPLRSLTEPADARLFLEAVLDLLGSAEATRAFRTSVASTSAYRLCTSDLTRRHGWPPRGQSRH